MGYFPNPLNVPTVPFPGLLLHGNITSNCQSRWFRAYGPSSFNEPSLLYFLHVLSNDGPLRCPSCPVQKAAALSWGAISMDSPRKIIFWAIMKVRIHFIHLSPTTLNSHQDKPALRDKWTLTRDGKFSFDDFDFYGNQMCLSPFVRQEIRKEFAISIGGQHLKHTGGTFMVPHTVQVIHFVEVGMTKEEAAMAVWAYKEPPSPSKWIDIRVFHKVRSH